MFNNISFFSKKHTVYELMSKNLVEPEGPQVTMQYGPCGLRVACWIIKATRAHTYAHAHANGHPLTYTHAWMRTRSHAPTCAYREERQEWFRKRASLLHYTYLASLVVIYNLF